MTAGLLPREQKYTNLSVAAADPGLQGYGVCTRQNFAHFLRDATRQKGFPSSTDKVTYYYFFCLSNMAIFVLCSCYGAILFFILITFWDERAKFEIEIPLLPPVSVQQLNIVPALVQ